MEFEMYILGERIRTIRKDRHLSVSQMANGLGITPSHLSHIESGRVRVGVPMLVEICSILETDANTLLGMDSRSLIEKRIAELDPEKAEIARVTLETIVEKIADIYEGRN